MTLRTETGRTAQCTLAVNMPPAAVMDADAADRILINAPDYTEPKESGLVLIERLNSLG